MLSSQGSAQTLDYSVSRIDIIQTIPNVTLVADKPAFVRAHVVFTGSQPDGTLVDGVMRVFVDGVEESYSPVFSDNGPLTPPASINLAIENHSLNFIFQPPASGDLVVSVEVNPPGAGRVPETDYSNNTRTNGSRDVIQTRRPRVTYVPIDYRPNGGGANLPDLALIEPGAGDNFIQGIYPSSDWSYRPSDAASKLWTSNLNSSGSGLLSSLLVDLNMSVPKPDFIYGWVPGSLPYNGQANGVPGKAAMGNTQSIRHQRTFAHELGHLLGRNHINNTIGVNGVDVERHLNITEGLPRIKPGSLFDVMVAGLLTPQAWVYDINYEFYITRPAFTPEVSSVVSSSARHFMLAGVWERELGTLEVLDSLAFRGAVPSEFVPLRLADLIVRVHLAQGSIQEFGLRVNPTTDSCADVGAASGEEGADKVSSADSEQGADASAPFAVVLPAYINPDRIQRIELVDAQSSLQLAQLVQSANAPRLQVSSARLGAGAGANTLSLIWSAQDDDAPELKHYVRYSPDGVRMVNLVTGSEVSSLQVDMLGLPEVVPGLGFFEILSSDGLRTAEARVMALAGGTQQRDGAVNPPSTQVLTPDTGMSFRRGATVILHSSGWDLEDLNIFGSSLQWDSNVDGPLGAGRLLSLSGLSVGAHVITVTATDSSGLSSSDSTSITIEDRTLPLLAAVVGRNGGANPMSFTAADPVLGSLWTSSVDLTTTGHDFAQVILFSAAANATLRGGQVLLIGGARVGTLPMTAGPLANFNSSIPNDPMLIGVTFYTQAVHIGGVTPFALSNSQDLTVGL